MYIIVRVRYAYCPLPYLKVPAWGAPSLRSDCVSQALAVPAKGAIEGQSGGNWAEGRQESARQSTVGARGSWVHAGGGVEAVGALLF